MKNASAWIAQGAAGLLAAMVLLSAMGPLATDDLWWHLALGHAYAGWGPEAGLAIDADPHLHTALHAPPANAWLFDFAVAKIDSHLGLQALRSVHAALLITILLVVARLLYVRSRSLAYAGLGTSIFITCAAYRLVQFRPDLLTLLATVSLALLLFARPSAPASAGVCEPSKTQAALAILLCALWSNLHPGFLLGPVLIATAAAGAGFGALIGPVHLRAADLNRALRLAGISAAALLATTLNPDGMDSLLRYFNAGLDSAGQAMVIDEWRSFAPFVWPTTTLPPAPLPFAVFWLGLIATPLALAHSLQRRLAQRRASLSAAAEEAGSNASRDSGSDIDLALAALALVGILAPFVAVRFLWLIVFPVLLGAELWRNARSAAAEHAERGHRRIGRLAALIAFLALLLVPTYWFGAERAATPRFAQTKDYNAAFDTDRYSAHAVWFLSDSEVEGRLFHPYFMGGFLDYWLAPKCQTFIDGSLNVPPSVLADYGRFQRLDPNPSTENREAILDAYEIDFFVGVGLPTPPLKGRPWRYTTNDLARSENWMLVFRNLRSAVYMRRHPRNAENLARISAYYSRAGVPFSNSAGLDVAAVLSGAPEWAIQQGVAPHDFEGLKQAALSHGLRQGWAQGRGQRVRPELRALARDRLAMTYAVLDLCEEALALDQQPILHRSDTGSAPLSIRAPARKRRIEACRERLSGAASPRAIWLTSIEAGRIKGVQRKASTRKRNRHVPYSGSQ